MPVTTDTRNDMLIEAVTFDGSDYLVGYSARNLRSRVWSGATLATYFKSQLSVVAVDINTNTNVITVTNGDGSTVTGTVTS